MLAFRLQIDDWFSPGSWQMAGVEPSSLQLSKFSITQCHMSQLSIGNGPVAAVGLIFKAKEVAFWTNSHHIWLYHAGS